MSGTSKKIIAIIPARMASTRFPGKPLANILGLPMIEHVRRRVSLCSDLSKVIVATCDKEIKDAVERYGGNVIMTKDTHERCTDRIAEAAHHVDADIIVNVQGDEPLIMPNMISALIRPMLEEECQCVNLVSPILSEEEFKNPNVIKTVFDIQNNILCFSRESIPSDSKIKEPFKKYKQLGIIAFTKSMLMLYSRLEQTPLEKIESIDMMRILENHHTIKAVIVNEPSYGVDTFEDLKKVEVIMKEDSIVGKYSG